MLPLMMMGGMGGAQGQAGAMNPMMMMLLLDDDSSSAKTKVACDKKYKLNHAFKWDGAKFVKTTGTAVRATVEHIKASASSYPTAQTIINDYNTCLAAATHDDGRYERRFRRYGPDDDDAHAQRLNSTI